MIHVIRYNFARSLFILGLPLALIFDAQGASKGKTAIPWACSAASPTANPIRPVVIAPVGSQVFQLPGGVAANFQADLQSMLNTAVTNQSNFAPVAPAMGALPVPLSHQCESHLELRATVSTFQLDAVQLGFSIGFNPRGSIPVITGVTGKAQMNVGNISMDFGVFNCVQGICTGVAASTANHSTVGGSISLEVDFGMISTGPQLLLNTPLGDIMRKIMNQGVLLLGQSIHLNEIPWEAHVREYIPAAGTLVFDAGYQSRIAPQQEFEIYARDSASAPVCGVYQILAYAHTTQVSAVSSVAVVDWSVNHRSLGSSSTSAGDLILPGDVVMIHVGTIP